MNADNRYEYKIDQTLKEILQTMSYEQIFATACLLLEYMKQDNRLYSFNLLETIRRIGNTNSPSPTRITGIVQRAAKPDCLGVIRAYNLRDTVLFNYSSIRGNFRELEPGDCVNLNLSDDILPSPQAKTVWPVTQSKRFDLQLAAHKKTTG